MTYACQITCHITVMGVASARFSGGCLLRQVRKGLSRSSIHWRSCNGWNCRGERIVTMARNVQVLRWVGCVAS